MRRLLPALWAALTACGDNRAGAPDTAGDPGFESAPHAPMPVVYAHTGTVLESLELVTVTYSDYADRDAVAAFGDALVASDWYRTIGGEYGMSAARHVQQVALGAAPAAVTRASIAQQILELLASRSDVVQPAGIDNQVLYLLYVPGGVARDADLAGISGYHEALTFRGAAFPIAVVFEDAGGLPELITRATHQVINAVTDPYLPPRDGYYADPPKTDPWCLLRGEIADLCQGEDPVVEGDYAFARVYSSAAVTHNLPPCIPAQPGDVWSDVTAEPSQIQGISPGGSVQFKLTGWSTHPVPDWKIQLQITESSQLGEDEIRPELSSDTINNFATVTLTLHAPLEAWPGVIGGVTVLSGTNRRPWAVGFVVR